MHLELNTFTPRPTEANPDPAEITRVILVADARVWTTTPEGKRTTKSEPNAQITLTFEQAQALLKVGVPMGRSDTTLTAAQIAALKK